MKMYSTEDLIKHMERIVKRDVKHYQSDFYDYDVDTIKRNKEPERRFFYMWVVRDCGTHLLPIGGADADTVKKGCDYLDAVRDCFAERKEYYLQYNPHSDTWTCEKRR